MWDLPVATEIKKVIYKKQLYEKFSKEFVKNKEKFDKEIRKITITHEISERTVNIRKTINTKGIFILLIDLKTKEYDKNHILLLARIIPQKMLFILHYGNEYCAVIYETKLIIGSWIQEENMQWNIKGLDLDAVWENFVTQVGHISIEEGNTLVEQLDKNAQKEKLKEYIESLKRKIQKEKQSKKKYELFQDLKKRERELQCMNEQ